MRLLFNVNVVWFFLSHRLEIARAARERGFEVHVAGTADSSEEVAVLRREGFVFHPVRVRRGALNPFYDLIYLKGLMAVMNSIRPDVVHNVTVKPIVYGTIAARRARVARIINAVSGLGYAFSGRNSRRLLTHLVRAAYRTALRRSGVKVIFQNEDDMQALVDANIVRRDQVVMIRGSGVDLEAFSFTPEPPGIPRVVLPARMLREKGVVEFAKACQMVRTVGINAEFVLAGRVDQDNPGGLGREELEGLVRETGVRWLGHVEDMAALIRECHIVCLPSYGEGLPKSLLEACACGRPIVTTDVRGCRDVVRDGENGLLVKPRDVQDLALALARLLEDAALRARMGMAGRRRAEAEFDVQAVVRSTLDLYQEALT